jgi:Predicted membrane protein
LLQKEERKPSHRYLQLVLKSLISLIGVAILALGATLCRVGNVGLDPFTALNIGVSGKLHLSLGLYQLLTNLVIILLVIFLDRKKIGIGTVFNMVFAGFMIDWFSSLYSMMFHYQPTLLTAVINGLLGLLLFTLGTSLYMTVDLGVAPYDALAPIFSSRLHIKYKFCRIAQDLLFMIAALLMSGPIGLATIIISFFAGPLITFWDHRFSEKVIHQVIEFGKDPSRKKIGHGFDVAGKSTYNFVKGSYVSTVEIQKKLSRYSDQELEQKQRQVRQSVRLARSILKKSVVQLGLLKREQHRRDQAKNQESADRESK